MNHYGTRNSVFKKSSATRRINNNLILDDWQNGSMAVVRVQKGKKRFINLIWTYTFYVKCKMLY